MKQRLAIWVLGIWVGLGWPVYELSRPAQSFHAFYQSNPIQITSSLELDWPPTPNADTYNVKRSLVHLGPYTTIATGIAVNRYIDSTVKPKTTYYYVISATNAIGESADSTEAQATTP